MCLRAEQGIVIADKTVLKMMHEMGVSCGIRRETDYHRYNSYKGRVGKTFENVIGRDFEAAGPRKKMGTDITGFKQPWGKAYFAPIYDFGSKEIVAWSTSLHPNMAQQYELLDRLLAKMPEESAPVLHSASGAGTTGGPAGRRYARGSASSGACRARAAAPTTRAWRASSARSRASSSTRRTGRGGRRRTSWRRWTSGCAGSARDAYPRGSGGSRPTSAAPRWAIRCRRMYKKTSAVPTGRRGLHTYENWQAWPFGAGNSQLLSFFRECWTQLVFGLAAIASV